MNKTGPIIVIEDDLDDQHILQEVFTELDFGNEIMFFADGQEALDYLRQDKVFPFLILSDINLPKLNGFELRNMVYTNNELSHKCIPYIFFSTGVGRNAVYDAYTMTVQGFFSKPSSYPKLLSTIKVIIEYWRECYSPNSYAEE